MSEKILSGIDEQAWWVNDQEFFNFMFGLDEGENSLIGPNTQPPAESQNSLLNQHMIGSNTQPPAESQNYMLNQHMFSVIF